MYFHITIKYTEEILDKYDLYKRRIKEFNGQQDLN